VAAIMNTLLDAIHLTMALPLIVAGVFWLALVVRRLGGSTQHLVVDYVLAALAVLWSIAASLRFYPGAGINDPFVFSGKPYFLFPSIWWLTALGFLLLLVASLISLGGIDSPFFKFARFLLWCYLAAVASVVFTFGARLIVSALASLNMLM
jgi:hypothetical protein